MLYVLKLSILVTMIVYTVIILSLQMGRLRLKEENICLKIRQKNYLIGLQKNSGRVLRGENAERDINAEKILKRRRFGGFRAQVDLGIIGRADVILQT